MPFIEVTRHIAGPPEAAYGLAKDMEAYPQFMDAVVSLQVVERRPDGSTVTAWAARFQGKILRWTEHDVFDDQRCHIAYRQVQGDLKRFEGEWRFVPDEGGTRVTLTVDFDLGIPMFASLLDPVAKLIVRRNCEAMLTAIQRQVEGGSTAGEAVDRHLGAAGGGAAGPR
jgi:coenzyme Q-binding protein COQ10